MNRQSKTQITGLCVDCIPVRELSSQVKGIEMHLHGTGPPAILNLG
jgi:hypothetical protein